MNENSMNCLEFRRRLSAAPCDADVELHAHAAHCSGCKQFKRKALAGEAALRRALCVTPPDSLSARIKLNKTMTTARAADADASLRDAVMLPRPDGLVARIMDRSALERARARHRGNVLQFGMAASVALAVFVGSIMLLRPAPIESQDSSLMSAVVTHSLSHTTGYDQTVPQERLTPVLQMVGLDFAKSPSRTITSATACDIEDQRSLHLVMRGEQGPVNVYVMPSQHALTTERVQRAQLQALLVPVRHGSIAVIGRPREDLSGYAQELKKNLRWRM